MKYFAMALGLFALIVLGTVAFSQLDILWQDWQPATCAPDHCFCEAQREGAIKQPANTYSNLFFVLAGLLVLADYLATRSAPRANFIQQHAAYPLVYGAVLIVLGCGSFFYHASLTFIGQWFDVQGMYLQITFVLLYAFARWHYWPGKIFAAGYVVANILLGAGLVIIPHYRREIFGMLVLAAFVLELSVVRMRQIKVAARYFCAALLVFAVAYVIWILDNTGAWCNPNAWLQGHAVWHLLSALAAGLIYLYYRSEASTFPQTVQADR